MASLVFVDTNVLVYLRDASEPTKQRMAAEWLAHLWETRSGRISTQVLQEYYVTVTAKLDPGLPPDEAREDIVALASAWTPQPATSETIEQAWAVQDRFGFSFWDAMIVASAGVAGCDILLTEDLQDGQDLGGVIVRSPFANDPPG